MCKCRKRAPRNFLSCALDATQRTATNSASRYSIVGKGNHSANHIQKIKPRVEQVCRELGLQYTTEDNDGRIYVNLTGGEAVMPPSTGYQGGAGYPGQQQGHQQHQQQQHGQGHQQQQQQQQPDELEELAKKFVPRILRKLEKACCVVM